jgi:radical SAM-linked protein
MKKQRFRINFSKNEQMKYTGHLDLILTWERIFRRAGIPLAYSEGYSPRPLLNMAAPLPLGYTSCGELGDFWLSESVQMDLFRSSMDKAVPPGIHINQVLELDDIHGPKLPSLVTASSYTTKITEKNKKLELNIKRILQSERITRIRKNKKYDLRSLVQDLDFDQKPDQTSEIKMTLTSLPGATGRPDEVLMELEVDPNLAQICRTEIILKREGET